jgi:hypothetical protein
MSLLHLIQPACPFSSINCKIQHLVLQSLILKSCKAFKDNIKPLKTSLQGLNPFCKLTTTVPVMESMMMVERIAPVSIMMERITSITHTATKELSFHYISPPQIVSKIVNVSLFKEE